MKIVYLQDCLIGRAKSKYISFLAFSAAVLLSGHFFHGDVQAANNSPSLTASAPKQLDGSWYLESNAVSLDPSNRFIGSLAATNPGRVPVYVRVTVQKLELKNNARTRSVEDSSALKAFPTEFILRPGESFPVRLLVDLGKQSSNSQSYYVKLEDVSNLALGPDNYKGAIGTAYLLAYEALVSVNKAPLDKLLPEHFSLAVLPNGNYGLTNLSGQHIYLNRGDACPDTKTVLVECSPVIGFPRQTMLPNEMLTFQQFDAPVLGILANAKLNMRVRSSLIHLQNPKGM